MKSRVYIETTIVSYLAARPSRDLISLAHQQITQDWWDGRRSHFELFVSELVVREAGMGDGEAASRRLALVQPLPMLQLNDVASHLARTLMKRNAIPAKAVEDALHISVATAHGMDYLLTWNCKHIANAETRNLIVTTCRAEGYEPPIICTPEELLGE